ncbi:MAG TPA: DinB family protein [Streptosporangiaceae bacterium]|nr:DinB family protein [Streptosporangiaceae bacterium]
MPLDQRLCLGELLLGPDDLDPQPDHRHPGTPRDRQARPSLEEVLALRHDRMAGVRKLIEGLTEESLAARTEPVHAPGWPPAEPFPVRECLSVVLNEEYLHRQFAERDLAVLESKARD